MKTILIIIFTIITNSVVFSQNLDSIFKVVEKMPDELKKIRKIYNISNKINFNFKKEINLLYQIYFTLFYSIEKVFR